MLHIAERVLVTFAGTLAASLALLIMSGVGAVFFGVFDRLCLFIIRLGDPLRRLVGKPSTATIIHPGADIICVAVEDSGPHWSPMAKIGLCAFLLLAGVMWGEQTANKRHYDYRPGLEYVLTPPAASCKPMAAPAAAERPQLALPPGARSPR